MPEIRSAFFKAGLASLIISLSGITHAEVYTLNTDFQDTQPKFIKTSQGFTGVCVEILQALKQRLEHHDLTIAMPDRFTPIKRIRKKLLSGQTDMYCGFARTEDREKHFGFAETPLYPVQNIGISRAEDQLTLNKLQDLKQQNIKTSTLFGTNTYHYLKDEQKLNMGPSPTAPEEGLALVQAGRTDFFVYHSLGLPWMLKQSPFRDELQLQPVILREYHHWMMLNPNLDKQYQVLINQELNALKQQGILASILHKYTRTD